MDGFGRPADHRPAFFSSLLGASVAMRLERAGRVPDIVFVAADHLDRLTETQLRGPADLVVEVVSDDSLEHDREEKLAEDAAAGVPEYWQVDSRLGEHRAEFFRLVDGGYRPVTPDADRRYRSAVVPGFWLRPSWLEQDPLPDALDCLFEIAPDLLAAKLRNAPVQRTGPGIDDAGSPVG